MELSVVIPVFNEADNVGPLCERLHETLSRLGRRYEVILVDDGSTDETWDRLREAARRFPHLRLIRLRTNFGQTAALSAGFHQARGDLVVTMDADLQNDPADIPDLLGEMDKGYDVVSGWRQRRKDPFFTRRLPSLVANRLISRITGVPLHDYGCTLKVYRREVIRDIRLYGEMHRFLPALASWVGGRIGEKPVRHHPRLHGHSKYGLSRIVRVILDLFTVKFLLRYSTGPMQIFGKIGLLFGGPGLLLLAVMVLGNLSYHLFGTERCAWLIKRPFWIMSAFMLIFFGIQFVCMGLLAEILIRTWHESQGKPVYGVREIFESPERTG